MQDELKNVISQAMNTSSEFEHEPIAQFDEGELSDEALEAVAGGFCCHPLKRTVVPWPAKTWFGCPRPKL
jgi:hypothetical protein